MLGVRHRGVRRLGALFLLALLSCPIALSGHRHPAAEPGTSRSCTICAATAHAPAVSAPALPQFALLPQGLSAEWLACTPPPSAERWTRGPRAPPSTSSPLVA